MTYTEEVESIAKELGVEFDVAMDIQHLRAYEERIVRAAKKHPEVRNFEVHNTALETQLQALGVE